ncbi:MAG: hypothetical protein K1X53_03700, partial [Candidatus Sumerlaeaceae bacterium]|nr:hypothetical protein [Candidatus Sumerlaeaceae bacterium]
MKIALCQLNSITGNVDYNTRQICAMIREAADAGARLAIFPEMSVTGYPPKDLLEYPDFVDSAGDALTTIQDTCVKARVDCLVGTVQTNMFGGKKELLNAAAYLSASGGVQFGFKKLLPTYDVFDEQRYFHPCPPDSPPLVIGYSGVRDMPGGILRIGVSICEDIWNDSQFWKDDRLYEFDPVERIAKSGANLIVNISASPFVVGKPA